MDAKDLIGQGIMAAKRGQNEKARELFNLALVTEPRSENAWLWLSTVAVDDAEKEDCLRQVLAINPNNAQCRQRIAETQRETAQRTQRRKLRRSPPPKRRWIRRALKPRPRRYWRSRGRCRRGCAPGRQTARPKPRPAARRSSAAAARGEVCHHRRVWPADSDHHPRLVQPGQSDPESDHADDHLDAVADFDHSTDLDTHARPGRRRFVHCECARRRRPTRRRLR